MIKKVISLALIMLSTNSIAQEVTVILLAKEVAILTIDGKKQRFKTGQTIDGITLITANTQQASVKINNEIKTLTLGSGKNYKSEINRETIYKDATGMYTTVVSINGSKETTAIIDTGATTVAIDKKTANELGINYEKGRSVEVETAAGKRTGTLITLDSVKVGNLEIKNVPTVIAEDDIHTILLGMTFLNKTKMVINNDNIVLIKK